MTSADMGDWITCPACKTESRLRTYDIGSGPEYCCPACEWCWGAEGQDLKPLDVSWVPCPECRAGKHGNCDGTTWNFAKDEEAPCPCGMAEHRKVLGA